MGIAFVLCMTNLAISAVCAYDVFGYETGAIVGQSSPALGFTGAWMNAGGNGSQCTVLAANLAYAGVDSALQDASGMLQIIVPDSVGGRAGRFLDTDPNGVFSEYVNAQGTLGKPGQTIYISYLMKTSATNYFYAFELKKADLGDGGARLYIGNDMDGSNLQVCAYRNRDQSPANIGKQFQWLGAATTNTELFVVRIDFGTTGDNVTVYRNPSLEAEPVIAPHLVNAGFLDFNGISQCVWVGPAGRFAQFDEICIASTYADAVRFYNKPNRVQNPTPADGAVDITGDPGVTLSWQAGTGVTPTGYKVYFSDVLGDVLTEDAAAYQGTTTGTNLTIGSLNTDTTYYWSVTETAEPNDIPGVIWMLETHKTFPVVVSEPVSQQVFANDNASFTFAVTSASEVSYRWFDANGELADSGAISGTHTQTLVITGAQVANEGNYYCQATNSAGTITSNTAKLLVKRILGNWLLDGDPNEATTPSLDGTIVGSIDWVSTPFGTAASFTSGDYIVIPADPSLNVYNALSVSALVRFTGGSSNWATLVAKNGENEQGWALRRRGSEADVTFTLRGTVGDDDPSGRVVVADGQWHQVIGIYDSSAGKRYLYVDGRLDNVITDGGAINSTADPVMIGRVGADWANYFVGEMAQVKIYNYPLTDMEVAELYYSFSGETFCKERPEYDFDGDCAVNLKDLSIIAANWLSCGVYPDCYIP